MLLDLFLMLLGIVKFHALPLNQYIINLHWTCRPRLWRFVCPAHFHNVLLMIYIFLIALYPVLFIIYRFLCDIAQFIHVSIRFNQPCILPGNIDFFNRTGMRLRRRF